MTGTCLVLALAWRQFRADLAAEIEEGQRAMDAAPAKLQNIAVTSRGH